MRAMKAMRDNWAATLLANDLPVDGSFGFRTTMAIQSLLVKEGFPTGPIDGRFGSKTRKALQAFLTANGYDVGPTNGWFSWTRQTVRALQMWAKDVGADPGPIDGYWGRRTTCALQMALNLIKDKWSTFDPSMLKATKEMPTAPTKEYPPAEDPSEAAPMSEAPWWQKVLGGDKKDPETAAGAA